MKIKLIENIGSNPEAEAGVHFKRSSRMNGAERKKMGKHVVVMLSS